MFDYIWMDENGDIVTTGDTFEQTALGEFTVTIQLQGDATCIDGTNPPVGITEFGSIPEPMVSGVCVLDTFRATFFVPEFIGTGDAPDVTFGAGQNGRIQLIDPATGEYEVSFATDVQDFVDVSLAGSAGCPSTDFMITADMICSATFVCNVPEVTGPLTIIVMSCVDNAGQIALTLDVDNNAGYDPLIHDVIWFNAADINETNPLGTGPQVIVDNLMGPNDFFARIFDRRDSTCQSDMSRTLSFATPDPSFIIDDFCIDSIMQAQAIVTGDPGGTFSFFGGAPIDGTSIDSNGVITTTNPNGCLLYTSPSPRDLSTSRMPSSA